MMVNEMLKSVPRSVFFVIMKQTLKYSINDVVGVLRLSRGCMWMNLEMRESFS